MEEGKDNSCPELATAEQRLLVGSTLFGVLRINGSLCMVAVNWPFHLHKGGDTNHGLSIGQDQKLGSLHVLPLWPYSEI